MTKKNQFLLLLIGVSIFNCSSVVKNSIPSISNLVTDFPVTEKLEFRPFKKYDIQKSGKCVIDASILWHFEKGSRDFGSCYDLNTGKKLAVIASRGKAANELAELERFNIVGDSVLLYANKNTIKTFAKKDIVNNIPLGDRKFSVITASDSILTSNMTKFSNGFVLATIRPAIFEFEKEKVNEINKKSVVIFNNNEAKAYETIKYDSFDAEKAKDTELTANDLIKYAYAQGSIATKANDMAVFSVNHQFILYTFDFNNGNVVNEKRYTKIQRDGDEMSFITINDMHLSIRFIKVNDKYILCKVDGYFNEEDKKSELQKEAIFVFDWNLNPIKKFELPNRKNGYYRISNDCNSVYFCEYNEDGLMLHKADLTI